MSQQKIYAKRKIAYKKAKSRT